MADIVLGLFPFFFFMYMRSFESFVFIAFDAKRSLAQGIELFYVKEEKRMFGGDKISVERWV